MKQHQNIIQYKEYNNIESLNEAEQNLYQSAHKAMQNANARFSQFFVGAALLLENNQIVTGSNQESSVYPLGLCAERVAVFAAANQYPKQKIIAIAICASNKNQPVNKTITPCGSCRQLLYEKEFQFQQPIKVILQAENGKILVFEGMKNLLPFAFNEDVLPGKKD